MDLPKKETVFDFDYTSESGHRYEGAFTVRCALNIALRHQLELEKTRLMGDHNNPSDGLHGLAVILSKLRVHIVDAPEWWKQSNGGFSLEDEDTLVTLYNKVGEAEDQWKESLKTKGKEAIEKSEALKKPEEAEA